MKYYTTFILCFLLPITLGDELGGIKVGINDKFISNLMRHFEPELRKVLEQFSIPNSDLLKNAVFGIPNFNMNMVKIKIYKFLNLIQTVSITINNCSPYVRSTIKVLGQRKLEAKLKNFVLDAKVSFKSRPVSGGGYGPDIDFISDPDIHFDPDISVSGFLGGIIAWFIKFAKPYIIKIVQSKVRDYLKAFLNKFETKIRLYKNYWLDFTLVSPIIPIKQKGTFLELNSYGFFYSDKNKSTQNRNKYPLTPMPSINTLEKNLKLYVSEYSINNAIYTLLSDSNNVLNIKVNINMLDMVFPGIADKYGEKQVTIILSGSPESKIKITNQNLYAQVSGTFGLKIDGIQNEVFKCNLDLTLKGKVKITEGPKLSGEIKELNPKITKIIVNKVSDKIMENGFSSIQSNILPILNMFIENSLEFKFPTVMGITFTNINLELKDKYIVINYDITRNKVQQNGTINNCEEKCKVLKNIFRKLWCKKACNSLK